MVKYLELWEGCRALSELKIRHGAVSIPLKILCDLIPLDMKLPVLISQTQQEQLIKKLKTNKVVNR